MGDEYVERLERALKEALLALQLETGRCACGKDVWDDEYPHEDECLLELLKSKVGT